MEKNEDIKEKIPRVRQFEAKTWYGLPVEIAVSSDNFHRIAVPGLAIPHPGLVNLLTRQGLPEELRLALTAKHELGHLQTLPISLLHLALILWPLRGRPSGSPLTRWLVTLLAHQAAWEVAAEGYVLATDRRAILAPRPPWARTLYVGFWGGMLWLAVAGTLFLLRHREKS